MQEFDEWKIFEKSEYELMKELDFNNCSKAGYIYILEYGEYVKIGTTKEPYKRVRNLSSLGRDYANIETGRIAVSPTHTNRNSNENILHELFSDKRVKNGELFSVSLENALKTIRENPLEYLLEESKNDIEDFSKWLTHMFIGNRYNLPKRKTKPPIYVCWEEEFEDKLFVLSLKSGRKGEDLYKEVASYIESLANFENYKDIYEKEVGGYRRAMDIVSYFPELARMADDYLAKIEEITAREIKD